MTLGQAVPELAPETQVPHQTLAAVFLRFLRFGCLAWGGPVAQIAMIQRELVEEQHWITPARFRRALAVYQVLPGPEAHELCVYFGMLARGRLGAILAGLGFMLPGFALILGLSALYANGDLRTAALQPVFAGLQAAVVALIVRALVRIGRHSLQDRWYFGVALVSGVATMLGGHFAIALACGGTFCSLRNKKQQPAALTVAAAFASWILLQWLTKTTLPDSPGAPIQATAAPSTIALFTSGLRTGLLTFGGAYTAIPFLQSDAVAGGAWMTNDQFLDGLALSGILPAPLIIFATFVGYVGGGLLGAVVMTTGIFLPAFCFTLFGHRLFERITENRAAHTFLDGVTAAVVGIMGATTVGLVHAGVTDLRGACIALAGLVLLFTWRSRAAVPLTVVAGGLLGLLLS